MINYWITAYIVRAPEREQLVRWARGRDLWSLRLHETASTTDVFLGEYPWAPAFVTQHEAQIDQPWTRLDRRLPVPVLQPAVTYYWESNGYDASLEQTINLSMPAPTLISSRGASGVRSWPCERAKALFYNPSLAEPGPDVLLGRTSEFRAWLERRGCDLVWLLTGEKLVLEDRFGGDEKEWIGRLEISAVGYFTAHGWREWRVAFLNRGEGRRAQL